MVVSYQDADNCRIFFWVEQERVFGTSLDPMMYNIFYVVKMLIKGWLQMEVKIGEPYLVDELVVYFINENEALVTDFDCRYELRASEVTCECCTFRFRSRANPGFACRHIKAIKSMKNKYHPGPGQD